MSSIANTFGEYHMLHKGYLWIRRNLEWLAPMCVASSLVYNHDYIALQFINKIWKIDSFYSAMFDWSSIQSAFLFGIYAFFLSKSEPFLNAISQTKKFKQLRSYIMKSLILTMLLTLISLPLLVYPVEITRETTWDLGFCIFFFILIYFSYAFFSFIKVVRVFAKIEKVGS